MYLDLTYIIMVLPAVIFSLWASWNVKHTYRKYEKQINSRGLTGADAARRVLDANGLRNVPVECVSGELTDHYDPQANVIRLSESVFGSASTAAVGVACHEVGHAIQTAQDYLPGRIRQAIIPATNFGAKLSIPMLLLGLFLSSYSQKFLYLAYAGVALYALVALFQIVTLPTEFDASRRALRTIEGMGLLEGEELTGAKKVLSAAALTYVAALATTLMQLLRLFMAVNNRRR
ncbi:MAG: zinc metallopeptidase [Oscillospiraceae bacterium]|nr:zinc metallopeptidase [Oscillospiraceae bacterium]